jgi:uncharacterized protein YjbI with pentapeptide repeats
MGSSAGGVFLPLDPPPSTNQVLTTPTIIGATVTGASLVNASITGATITGTVTVATGASLINPSITGAVITGTVTVATGAALINPSITGAVVTGTVTVASGATLTTPTVIFTSSDVIATGATGSTAAAAPSVYPAFVHCNSTGVSGAGLNLPTGAAVAGAFYVIMNSMTGDLNIYSTGATINGVTGTTAFALTATGNRTAIAACSVAGAWRIHGNT